MAKKPFEIQGSTLRIAGVDLEAGRTSIVIPGITRATTYSVDEVDDSGDQEITFNEVPVVIDIVIFNDYVANGSTAMRAEYLAELEDDGYIDEIEVNYGGVYLVQDYNDMMGANPLLAYTGTAVDPFSPFVEEDWTSIPFRVRMRAGEVENVGGGTGGGLEQRDIEFPAGESGDTKGTLAQTDSGAVYVCVQDWEDYSEYAGEYSGLETFEDFLPSQTGFVSNSATILLSDVPEEILYILNNSEIIPGDWEISMDDEAFGGWQTCTSVGFNVNGDVYFMWPYRDGTDPNGFVDGSGFSVIYNGTAPQPDIWERIVTGSDGLLGDLTVENGDTITNGAGGITLAADGDILVESDDDIRLTASDQLQLRSYGDDVDIITNYDDLTEHTWSFGRDGELTFPDGTVQTTAYNPNRSEFVLVNQDGGVYGSTDGENWSGPFDTGLVTLRRVAVGPSMVVYIGGTNAEDGDDNNLHYTTAWDVTPTVVTDEATANWRQVRYFSGIGRFVAVGSIDGTAAYKHSSDGVTWVTVYIDGDWAATLNEGAGAGPSVFTDVATNGAGFLLTTDNTTLGSFYTTTLTSNSSIGESAWLNDGLDFREVVYAAQGDFTGWFAFGGGDIGEDDVWWFNGAFDPGNDSFADFLGVVGNVFAGDVGYDPQWSELVIGRYDGIDTIVVATGGGQIAYWPAVPAGPFISIPKPYVSDVSDIVRGTTTTITYNDTAGYIPAADGEKIVISGVTSTDASEPGTSEQSYDGEYYIKNNNDTYELYTDSALTTPWDTTTYWPVNTDTGTLTWSHGQYIDALNYANGNFYVANDDEEVFVSTDGGATWTEVASLNPGGEGGEGGDGPGTGTAYMNDIDGFVGTVGSAGTGNFTFSADTITNANGMTLVTDRGTLAIGTDMEVPGVPTHFHIAFDGSNTEASLNDLFLGDDFNYVQVRAFAQGINIGATDRIGGDQQEWRFSTDGTLTLPGNIIFPINNSYIEDSEGFFVATDSGFQIQTNKTAGQHNFTFSIDGTTTLPGAVVNSTVSKDGAFFTGEVDTFSLSPTNNTNFTPGTYPGLTTAGVSITIVVAENGDLSGTLVSSIGGFSVNDQITILGGAISGGTTGIDDITVTVDTITNVPGPTAIDLTRTVNILSSGGNYSLADGAEGQIMYFVPASGITNDVYVVIANARIMGEGPTDTTDYSWTPFTGELLAPTTIAMAIFADGAWCLRGGATD